MKIYYHLSEYISHRRAGQAYMACLAAMGHELVADPAQSDIAVLHEEPSLAAEAIAAMPPKPGRKHVGYAVWETPQLPRMYAEAVAAMDAVWTCSEFSRQAFAPYARTFVLPHVVERPKVTRADMDWAMGRLGITEKQREARQTFYFYTIVDTVNPRKDVETLLAAFSTAFPGQEQAVKLVTKQYRHPKPLEQLPYIIDIPEMLEDGQLAALHAVCDAYVSAHHAEAWGLPLSEALSFGNPVIATGYSGNMEFMNAENSFPVQYTVSQVSERMCKALPKLFTPDMTWADIDFAHLVQLLRQIRTRRVTPEFRKRAAASMKAFASAAIQERLHSLLAAL
ncbi:glycosyltransferase [Desulfovibrio sp. OttesenSCG-928-O18]|nr:glycosyltransferase [Desulfovibrio sp. OttesenSCG-928-O18]